jgi:hypothetical protein
VDDAVEVPQPPPARSPSPERPSVGTTLTLVNGVLAGVTSVFVGTHSVLTTIIAALMAIALVAMVLVLHK